MFPDISMRIGTMYSRTTPGLIVKLPDTAKGLLADPIVVFAEITQSPGPHNCDKSIGAAASGAQNEPISNGKSRAADFLKFTKVSPKVK
jgi:hypothetical protein